MTGMNLDVVKARFQAPHARRLIAPRERAAGPDEQADHRVPRRRGWPGCPLLAIAAHEIGSAHPPAGPGGAVMKKQTILSLTADPGGTGSHWIGRQAGAMQKALDSCVHRKRFALNERSAIEWPDLLPALRTFNPTLVHFSGQGGPGGLAFHAIGGSGSHLVSIDAFADAFRAERASVKLVLLCNCYSEAQADALLAHVECVIGIDVSAPGDEAWVFATGFYGALGNGASVGAAYDDGMAALALARLPASAHLKVRSETAKRLVPAVLALADQTSCPYPGIRAYSAETAQYFHGRRAKVDELIGRLRRGEREIYVIGPSGSGKSSLIAAGVLPRLEGAGVPGLGPFVVRSIRPGDRPIARMREALGMPEGDAITAPGEAIAALCAGCAPEASVLIVIDQLQEVFTQTKADERTKFFDALQLLRTDPRCVVIFALRADFFGALMESPLWTDPISRIEVGPLRGAELAEAIEEPAKTLECIVESALTERLRSEAAFEPGILPLLQEVLVQLWDVGRKRMLERVGDPAAGRHTHIELTRADYDALSVEKQSGLAVVLSKRADATMAPLSGTQQAIARRIMIRLIHFGEGRPDTRRQQPRSKLRAESDSGDDFDMVLQRLADERLLTMSSERPGDVLVDLAHEVIITAWPTLERWVDTRRPDELRRRRLEDTAARWRELGAGARGLLDPIALAEVEAWRRTESAREVGESADEKALVAASRAAHRWRRRLVRGGVVAAVAIVVGVVVLGVRAHHSAHEAEVERKRREMSEHENRHRLAVQSRDHGRQLLLEGHPTRALPYLVEARRSGEEGPMLQMLYWAASRYFLIAPPLEHRGEVVSAVFSGDGARVVTASGDGTARIWNADTGKQLMGFEHRGAVRSAELSRDGARMVTVGTDKKAHLWDAVTGKELAMLEHRGSGKDDLPGQGSQSDRREEVRSAAFSPDGTSLLTAGDDGTARLWDASTGKPLATWFRHRESVQSAVFSLDGTRVVTASDDKTARVWNAATGDPLSPPLAHHAAVRAAALSPDGRKVVTVSGKTAAHVWDAATGRRLATLEHQGAVVSAAFSPDGARIVTASDDRTARIWDATTGAPIAAPLEHQGKVRSAAFSPDGARIVTAGADQTARVWDARNGKPVARPLEHQGDVLGAMFSSDGTRIVTASTDQTARVWDARTRRSLEHNGDVQRAVFSPDGNRVVTACSDHYARVWDVTTGKLIVTLAGDEGTVNSAAFSPDGTRIVTASDDRPPADVRHPDFRGVHIWDAGAGTQLASLVEHAGVVWSVFKSVRVWDARTGTQLASLVGHGGIVWSAEFSPDGTRLVTASGDKTARIWNAATGDPVTPALEHGGVVWSAVFSPDNTRVVTASADHTARIWDARSGTPCTKPLEHRNDVRSAVFSSDGTRVVTASWDNTARVWDAATGELLFVLEHDGIVRSAVFSPDNTHVVTASDDGTARIWDAGTGKGTKSLKHDKPVWSAAFNRDGTRVVTASEDESAHVWDAATGMLLATFDHPGGARSAMFSLDGKHVVTRSNGHTAHIWDIRLDETLEQWTLAARRSPFVLSNDGELDRRGPSSLGPAPGRPPESFIEPYPPLDR